MLPPLRRLLPFAAAALLLTGCDREPEQIYKPPTFTGTAAYVAGECDHLAMLDLETQRLTRIKVGRQVADLAVAGDRLWVLGEDGGLAGLDPDQGGDAPVVDWKPISAKGLAVAAGPDGVIYVLGDRELVLVAPDGNVLQRRPLDFAGTSLLHDGKNSRLWVLNREDGSATPISLPGLQAGTPVAPIGNSIHQGFVPAGSGELWIAEGNEYLDGQPYGVGYKKDGPAMPGGINVIGPADGKQTDFVMVGGNVADLAESPDGSRIYAATSRLPEYTEATLSVLEAASRRVRAEFRLCDACHVEENVEVSGKNAVVRALAMRWGATAGQGETKP